MIRWLPPILAIAAVLTIGLLLWWPPAGTPNRLSDLGTALVGGAVVAVALFYLERRLSQEAERRDLQLQLGLQLHLAGIDLSHRNLSGFYLVGKDLRGANLKNANLKRANLSGADLSHARLNRADLRGAKLSETPLYPSNTLYPGKTLYPGPIYKNATIQNTGFQGAKYDARTEWPRHINPEEIGAVQSIRFRRFRRPG